MTAAQKDPIIMTGKEEITINKCDFIEISKLAFQAIYTLDDAQYEKGIMPIESDDSVAGVIVALDRILEICELNGISSEETCGLVIVADETKI